MCPAFVDFTSVPNREIPASNVSSSSWSNFALLLYERSFLGGFFVMALVCLISLNYAIDRSGK